MSSTQLSSVQNFSSHPVMPDELRALVSKSAVLAIDFDGCILNSEPHQMKAFAALVNIKTGGNHDFRDVAREMVGKSERAIISIFKERHGLKESVDTLLQERENLYLSSLYANDPKPNPSILESLKLAKKLQIPAVVLTNGRKKIIIPLLAHMGMHTLFEAFYTVDHKDRRDFPDKVEFLANYARNKKISENGILLFEDSVSTLKKFEGPGVRVEHDLVRSDYIPNTGLILRFPGPR